MNIDAGETTMQRSLVLAFCLLASVAPVLAAEAPAPTQQFTTLDSCALKGRGFNVAGSDVCLKVTGGVSYWQTWGNAVGGDGSDRGQVIVTTPAGPSTIPAPRS